MVTKELRDAFRWHLQQVHARHNANHLSSAFTAERAPTWYAVGALKYARADVAAGKTHYPAPIKPYPAAHWQERKPHSSEGLAYVDNPESAGLRFVGRVAAEFRGDWRDTRGDTGWYTDPFGDVAKDGTGLCWGEVYQLPGRGGCTRFVAGYRFGGQDGGPTIDLGTVYVSDTDSDYYPSNRLSGDGTREAARSADSLAQHAAEAERDYQRAWEAGARYADMGEQAATDRKELLALLAERRAAKANAALYPTICAAAVQKVRNLLHDIYEARTARAELASGTYSRDEYHLGFYTSDADMRAAFNEGAGETVLDVFP